jgi:hypothetical protein
MKHRNYPLLAAAILLFIAPACLAQTRFPDTPAGNQTKAWMDAFNAGDIEKYREFYRRISPLGWSVLLEQWNCVRRTAASN